MFSVTYTGMNFLPLCTAMVCPTISGVMVERRDQVRSTFFSLRAFMPSIFVARCASTNGPFFVDRAIKSLSVETRRAASSLSRKRRWRFWLTLLPAAHDERVRPLVVARLEAACRLTPGRYRMPSARSLAFTTAMRMVDGVHGNAAVMRTFSHPARSSRFSPGDVFVIRVPNLSDGRQAVLKHFARFARRQLDQRVVAFLCDELRRTAC